MARLRPFDTSTPEGRSKERYRRIALTTASSMGARGIGVLVSLATVPLALSYLGKQQFGLYATITSLLAWVTVLNFGIVNGLVNAISQAHGKDDRQAAGSYASTAFFTLVVISALLGLVFALAAPFVPWSDVLAVRGLLDEGVVMWSVIAAVGAVLVGMPLSITPQMYAGYQRMYVANLFLVLGSLLTLIGVYVAVRLEVSLPVLILVFGGAAPVVTLCNLIFVSRYQMPWLRPRISQFSRAAVRRLMTTSVPLFLFQLAALLVNQTDLVVLAHRTDLGTVAEYAIILRVYGLLVTVIALGTYSFIPSFRESYERGDHGWMRASFRRLLYLRMALAVVGTLIMMAAGNWLLRIWLGQEAVSFGLEIWAAFAVVILAVTWVTTFSELLIIMDRIWSQVVLATINGIAVVLLTYWLAPTLGILGAVLALGFVTTVAWTWLLPLMVRPVLESERVT